LQAWFTGQMNEYRRGQSRRLIDWDEIVEGACPPPGAAMMAWRSEEAGFEAAAGRDVAMARKSVFYFDYYQSDDPDEPLAIGRLTTLPDVYRYEPVPATLPSDAAAHVPGTQFQDWTEYIPAPAMSSTWPFPERAP
jgi:hexosaminidase